MAENHLQAGSFRDPSGFLFYSNNQLLRQVNKSYRSDFEHLMSSGLYTRLTEEGLLVKHTEPEVQQGLTEDSFRIIAPEVIPFISYPYEWSFSQLKDAALITLKIQKIALQHGMTLKDASAYNIQFLRGEPVFIDTLSFEIYREGKPWEAYRQFCQHFLAPLTLMSYTDIRLNQMLKLYIDGIPLDLTSTLLPRMTKMNFLLLMHIHLHARSQKKYESKGTVSKEVRIKQSNLLALVDSLSYLVRKLKLKKQDTEWGEYYTFTNYNDASFSHKKEIIEGYVKESGAKTLWDLGANNGEFTRVAAATGVNCMAFDIDPLAVNANYNMLSKEGITNILPLVLDLTNPSPAIGWSNDERMDLKQRPHPDTILALAIIHHLAISNNLPFVKIAGFLAGLCTTLVIEFVPKSDSQVKKLLESRKDIFGVYDEAHFELAFSEFFDIASKTRIRESDRTVYMMKNRDKTLTFAG